MLVLETRSMTMPFPGSLYFRQLTLADAINFLN